MKAVWYAVSILALVVSPTSYAMEDIKENTRRPVKQRSRETHLELVKDKKLYLGSLPIHLSLKLETLTPSYVQGLCVEALKIPNLTELQEANIRLNYAGACLKLCQNEQAALSFQYALEIKSPKGDFVIKGDNRARTCYYAAKAYKKIEKYDYAIELCHYALKKVTRSDSSQPKQSGLYPSNALDRSKIFSCLGGVLKERAKKLGSIEAYKDVLELKNEEGRVVIGGLERANTYCFLANMLRAEKRNQEAVAYYHKALDAKNGRLHLLQGVARIRTFTRLAGTLSALKRDEEATSYYYKAINVTNENSYYILTEERRTQTLLQFLNILRSRNQMGQVKKILTQEAVNSYHMNFKKLSEVMKEEKVSIGFKGQDINLQRETELTDEEQENAVLNCCLQDLEKGELPPFEIAKRYEIIGNILHNKSVREKRWPSQASCKAYNLAYATKDAKGILPAYSKYHLERVLERITETQTSPYKLFSIQMSANRKRKQPPQGNQSTNREVRAKPMESSTQKSVAHLISRIKQALGAVGNLNIALANCNKLLSLRTVESQKAYDEALELKLEVLQQLGKVSQGVAKKQMQKEAADLVKLIRERQESPQSSRMTIQFLLNKTEKENTQEEPPFKRPRLQLEEKGL
ncbi:MAG: hypothetical protein BGO67_03070 [Alphaproteobacteria bacterium 41-28]|nr:MAG: hypothetical protein BGO67_03070 [Alphaproteobacteria bacterium 41-28]